MIIILLSPELAQMEACLDENPEFFMVRLHSYCLCRHTLLFVPFIKLDTGWFLIGPVSVQTGKQSFKFFIQGSACFAYFYCFHFGTGGRRMLEIHLIPFVFSSKVETTMCTGLPDAKRQPSHDRQMVDGSCQSPRRGQRRLLHKSHQVRIFVVQL